MAEVTPRSGRGWMTFPITGQVSHAAGDAGTLGHFTNPEGVPIIITRCIVYVSANSTGACNLTIGPGATATAAHDVATIFAAAAMAAAAGKAIEGMAHGDPADEGVVLGATEVIAAYASADSSGLAAVAHVEYIYPS
jgi:hypothetical protein